MSETRLQFMARLDKINKDNAYYDREAIDDPELSASELRRSIKRHHPSVWLGTKPDNLKEIRQAYNENKRLYDRQFDDLVEEAREEGKAFNVKAKDYITELWKILKTESLHLDDHFDVNDQIKARHRIQVACKDIWAKSTVTGVLNDLSLESKNATKSEAGKASASVRKSNTPAMTRHIIHVTLTDEDVKKIVMTSNQGDSATMEIDVAAQKILSIGPAVSPDQDTGFEHIGKMLGQAESA